MKANLTPEEFPDIVISFLLDAMMHLEDPDEHRSLDNEEFMEIAKALNGKGFRSKFLSYFRSLDGKRKIQYKHFKRVFEPIHSDAEIIKVKQNLSNDTQNKDKHKRDRFTGKKKDKEKESLVKKATQLATKLITHNADPNPQKLKLLEEKVIDYLKINGDL